MPFLLLAIKFVLKYVSVVQFICGLSAITILIILGFYGFLSIADITIYWALNDGFYIEFDDSNSAKMPEPRPTLKQEIEVAEISTQQNSNIDTDPFWGLLLLSISILIIIL